MRLQTFGAAIFFLSLFGCQKDDLTGGSVQPDDKVLNGKYLSVTELACGYSPKADRVSTNSSLYLNAGAYATEALGKSTFGFAMEFGFPTSSYDLAPSTQIDSVILSIHLVDWYGPDSKIDLQVGYLDTMLGDGVFHADTTMGIVEATITSHETPEFIVYVDSVAWPSHLRIPLNTARWQELMSDSVLFWETEEEYRSFFPGVVVQGMADGLLNDEGAVVRIDPEASASLVTLYMSAGDSAYAAAITHEPGDQRMNFSSFDRMGTNFETAGSDTMQADFFLVQGIGGVNGAIRANGLRSELSAARIINQAVLSIPMDSIQNAFSVVPRLKLYAKDTQSEWQPVYDLTDELMNGYADTVNSVYNISFAPFLQEWLIGANFQGIEDLELLVRPSNGHYRPHWVTLVNDTANGKVPELSIIYTED